MEEVEVPALRSAPQVKIPSSVASRRILRVIPVVVYLFLRIWVRMSIVLLLRRTMSRARLN